MFRFFQPNRVVTQPTRKKESSPQVAAVAAAAAAITSAVVAFTSSLSQKNQYSIHNNNYNKTNTSSRKSYNSFKESRINKSISSIQSSKDQSTTVASKKAVSNESYSLLHEAIQNIVTLNKNKYVKCENTNVASNKKSKIINFRQRRLTLNATSEDQMRDPSTSSEVTNRKEKDVTLNSRIMYSTEFDEENEKDIPSKSSSNGTKKILPFPSHQVGTYSCHGVEPHPFIVYSKGEKPTDSNIMYFFDKIFGTKSAENYTSARVVTISQKKINQDRGHVIFPFGNHKQTALFGVFDGHGECGDALAEYTMHAVFQKLHSHPSCHTMENIEQTFKDIFQEIDQELLNNEEKFKSMHSGSTACVVLLRDNNVWVANIGDSRAVSARISDDNTASGRQKLFAVDWSKDQNANDEEERLRVIQSGGYITMPDEEGLPARVWLDKECSQIGLGMSRSIGDHALKNVGVISEPKVKKYKITDKDEFFIIATDGVWEFISSNEAVNIIETCFANGMGASDACEVLIKEAMTKWKENEGDYRDDITAIIVRLKGLWDNTDNG